MEGGREDGEWGLGRKGERQGELTHDSGRNGDLIHPPLPTKFKLNDVNCGGT